jgi:trans-aconitate 2-methyltransferase
VNEALSAAAWRPDVYLRFADDRLRPGFDLLAQVGDLPPGPVYDLGCGAGQHARAMARLWPDRVVTGVDSSREMLAKAAALGPGPVQWAEGDIATWTPAGPPPALIFSNAAIQWLDGHQALLTRLLGLLAPSGMLAVQMPRNDGSPSQTLMRDLAAESPWRDTLAGARLLKPVVEPEVYFDWLVAAGAKDLNVWQSEFIHVLNGEDAVYDWISSTALRPVLERLSDAALDSYTAELKRRLRAAYPMRPDGTVLFRFLRLFFVARRPA